MRRCLRPYECVHACTHACMYVRMYVFMDGYVCMHVCMYAFILWAYSIINNCSATPTGDDVFSSPPDLSNHLVPNTFVSNAYNPIINVQYCAYGRSYAYSHLHLDRHL